MVSKKYSEMTLEQLQAALATTQQAFYQTRTEAKAEIKAINEALNLKLAEKKVAEMSEAERHAVGQVLGT